MNQLPIHARIRGLEGYQPGEQPTDGELLKLNTNENPYPPSPDVAAAIAEAAASGLERYPTPMADSLREAAARQYGVAPEQILAGNGSDELLNLCVRATVERDGVVAYSVPTYSLYRTLALLAGARVVEISARLGTIPDELARCRAGLVLVCSPNSPFGTSIPLEEIDRLASATEGLVVADEAYVDFGGETALPLVGTHDNLVVLRSFSKSFSLAGVRLGLAFGPGDLMAELSKVKDSYNVSRLAMAAGVAALGDYTWMEKNVARVRATRDRVTAALRELGYQVPDSAANFIWLGCGRNGGSRVYETLRASGILVRYFDVDGLREGVRVSIGTDAAMDRLLGVLESLHSRSR